MAITHQLSEIFSKKKKDSRQFHNILIINTLQYTPFLFKTNGLFLTEKR